MITPEQDRRLSSLFGKAWDYAREQDEGPVRLLETALVFLLNADERLKNMKRRKLLLYSFPRHCAVKALLKELTTGERARDPMVEAAIANIKFGSN